MKIAIIRLSSLGDIISTAVFLRFIKEEFSKKFGDVFITFIVDSAFREILQDSLYIDEICDIPLRASKSDKRLIFEIFKKLKSLQKFDLVIDFQGLLKSAIIGRILKSDEFVGYAKNSIREKIASYFYTKKIEIPYEEHILKRQYEIIKNILDLDLDFSFSLLDNKKGVILPSNTAKNEMKKNIESKKTNILFILEASKREKEYPLELFYEVAMGLKEQINNLAIYLIWDKKEKEIKNLGTKDSVFCTLERLNLDKIKALILDMNLIIGGDTGITHLSWALDIPAITLYGNTPLKRFELCGDKYISISHLNTTRILKNDFSINKIEPKKIVESAILLLGKK